MDDVVARHRPARVAERRWLWLEPLEPRMLLSASPSPFEQEMLWLINDMRTDPADHLDHFITGYGTPASSSNGDIDSALDYFDVVGATLQSDWSTLTATAPVAWSSLLDDAAEFHSQNMIDEDAQEHEFPDGPGLGERIDAAGYVWTNLAENIFAFSKSALHGHAGFVVDWGNGIDGMQNPPGHRNNIMNPLWVHVGIASIFENDGDTGVGPYVVTQDFAKPWPDADPYLVGTIWADANADGKFDGGEGFGGVTVTAVGAATYSTTSWGAGGYQLQLPADTYDVSISGGAFAPAYSAQVTIADENVKLDANPQGAEVVARHVFYNNSALDGNDPATGAADDAAIAPNKALLRPGGTPGDTHQSNYSRGINGLMVDIDELPGEVTAPDFDFKVNSSGDPNNWTTAPAPTSITVREDAGDDGSDRITIIWADGAIQNQWIKVTVKPNANTDLENEDVFYFGNTVGDTDGDGQVGSSDYGTFVSEFGRNGGITTPGADFNADGWVDLIDFAIVRGARGNSVLAPTIPAAAPAAPPAAGGEAGLDVLAVPGLVTSVNQEIVNPEIANPEIVDPEIANVKTVAPRQVKAAPGRRTPNNDAAAPIDLLALISLSKVEGSGSKRSATSYIPDPQPISVGSPATTPYRAATGEYDLRPLGDDLPAHQGDDLPADILAESALALPL